MVVARAGLLLVFFLATVAGASDPRAARHRAAVGPGNTAPAAAAARKASMTCKQLDMPPRIQWMNNGGALRV
jgi:hypothetical protein